MVDEISERVGDWLPDDVTDPEEIKRAVEDSGFNQGWGEGTERAIRDNLVADRDPDQPADMRDARAATDVMGPQGGRTAAVRAADGTTLGDPDDVAVWTDRHGNLMGHNSNTGTRKKITDSSER